jgi:serine/threonine protein kinase
LLGRYDSAFLENAAASELLCNPISSDTMIGRQLGAYRIVKEIGHGGMAVVFLAERADQEYRKRVAVNASSAALMALH